MCCMKRSNHDDACAFLNSCDIFNLKVLVVASHIAFLVYHWLRLADFVWYNKHYKFLLEWFLHFPMCKGWLV